MKLFGKFITTCLTLVVLFISGVADAQDGYRLLLKGERNPFDTAVATRIDKYRMDSRRIQIGDSLIRSLGIEVDSLTAQIRIMATIDSLQRAEISAHDQRHEETLKSIQGLSDSFDRLSDLATKPKPWWSFDWLPSWAKITIGVGAGIGISYLARN